MSISREEFESTLKEGQEVLLEILANNPNISIDKFYKVTNVLEYVNLFSGIIYSFIDNSSKEIGSAKEEQ